MPEIHMDTILEAKQIRTRNNNSKINSPNSNNNNSKPNSIQLQVTCYLNLAKMMTKVIRQHSCKESQYRRAHQVKAYHNKHNRSLIHLQVNALQILMNN